MTFQNWQNQCVIMGSRLAVAWNKGEEGSWAPSGSLLDGCVLLRQR